MEEQSSFKVPSEATAVAVEATLVWANALLRMDMTCQDCVCVPDIAILHCLSSMAWIHCSCCPRYRGYIG